MAAFDERFSTRAQAERYRDRYRTGRHARTDQREHEALRRLLAGVERVPAALDLPCGVGRFSSLLAEHADRIVMADSSPIMLELAREELPDLPAEYLCTCAEDIDLTDESVDLVFSHRFLTHIDDADLRRRILVELSRVSRRYLVLSFYPPSLRNRCRWSVGCAPAAQAPLRSTGDYGAVSGRSVSVRAASSRAGDPAGISSLGLLPIRACTGRCLPGARQGRGTSPSAANQDRTSRSCSILSLLMLF